MHYIYVLIKQQRIVSETVVQWSTFAVEHKESRVRDQLTSSIVFFIFIFLLFFFFSFLLFFFSFLLLFFYVSS